MSWEKVILLFAAAITVACARDNTSKIVSQPTLTQVQASESVGQEASLAPDTPEGFLRPCTTVMASGGVVELACGEHQVVEFRKGSSTGEAERDLDDVMEVLQARFGDLREERDEGRIDRFPVSISHFRTARAGGPRGLAIAVNNSQGRYWVFACYQKNGESNESFCQEAIAAGARAGGLAYVGAKPLQSFLSEILSVPKGCQSTENRVLCKDAQLRWSPLTGTPALQLRAEAVANMGAMAKVEKIVLSQEERECTLLKAKATCLLVSLKNPAKQEELNFVMATGGGQERLIVCSYSQLSSGQLPAPCDQVISL